MRYLSDKTNRAYDSVEELKAAEKEFDKKIAEEKAKRDARAARAKEVEDAYAKAQKLLDAFIKDYGSFHTSICDSNSSLFDFIFNHFPF